MNGEKDIKVVLEGKGRTKQESFVNAIGTLQKKLTAETEGTIIRIEPLDIQFIEGKEFRRTEKFMFFFMKREVSEFQIKIEATVKVFVVDHHAFEFETVTKPYSILK